MNILDEDMQMVRDFLTQANAPKRIKGHFENLVAEHAKEADRVEELQEEVDALTDEESARYQKLEEEFDEYKREAKEEADDRALDALETVKYWLHDVIVLGGPMRRRPREILRIVEETIG